jgi:hypothetical protein
MLPVKRRQRGCRDEKLLSPEISEFGELTRYSTWKAISPDFTMVREGGLCGVKGPVSQCAYISTGESLLLFESKYGGQL